MSMHVLTLHPRERIAIIGSGGKTTLMCNLARTCPGRAIMTTTTHLAPPANVSYPREPRCTQSSDGDPIAPSSQPARFVEPAPTYPGVFVPFTGIDALALHWRQGAPRLLTARLSCTKPHLTGLTPAEVDELSAWPDLDRLIVEADGSKRLPIKAHKAGEPVLFSQCTLGIAVIGLRALHRCAIEGEVHRASLLRQLLECTEEHRLTPADLARAAQAYLDCLHTPRLALVLSQAEHGTDEEREAVLQALSNMLGHAYPECELAVQARGELQAVTAR